MWNRKSSNSEATYQTYLGVLYGENIPGNAFIGTSVKDNPDRWKDRENGDITIGQFVDAINDIQCTIVK